MGFVAKNGGDGRCRLITNNLVNISHNAIPHQLFDGFYGTDPK
jgi:hypothetical protein